MFIAMAQSRWAAARGPGVFEGCSSGRSVRWLERAGQTAAGCPSRWSVPPCNSDALVASLNTSVSQHQPDAPQAAAARGAQRVAARSTQ